MGSDIGSILLRLIAILPALTFHEFAHAYTAYKCGDPTPYQHGRVTLNPLAHLDPIGTLMIMFGPIGWAKPVPINPANFRHPSRDIVWTSAVGPLANLVQGVLWCIVIRVLLLVTRYDVRDALVQRMNFQQSTGAIGLVLGLLGLMALINFCLCIFNLIPLGPLDGHHILEYKLPYDKAIRYRAFNQRYGFMILLGVILVSSWGRLPILSFVIVSPALFFGKLLTGESLLYLMGLI